MTTDGILLVDGDPTLLRVLQRAMEVAGYDVATAESGKAALKMAKSGSYAVAVIATELPDKPGLEVVHELASTSPQTEVIALTTDAGLTELAELYDAGNVYNHREKPLDDIANLARDIARALERRALRRHNTYLMSELRDARDEIRSQAGFFIQVERMAALGQLASGHLDELDRPLSILNDFAARLHDVFDAENGVSLTPEQQEEIAEFASSVEQAAKQCHSVIDGIRTFAQGIPGPIEATDLNSVVKETLGLLRYTLESNGIHLEKRLAKNLPAIFSRNPQLQQALTHLALNAVQAMPHGGTITVVTEVTAGEPAGVVLKLTDTGVGMEPRVVSHVFEPFFTTRPLGAGTGLGLTVTRALIGENDGEIQVASKPGEGTTFTITFPAAELEESDSEIAA